MFSFAVCNAEQRHNITRRTVCVCVGGGGGDVSEPRAIRLI